MRYNRCLIILSVVVVLIILYYTASFSTRQVVHLLNGESTLSPVRDASIIQEYPDILNCTVEYAIENTTSDYSLPVPDHLNALQITRGIVLYFPINGFSNFFIELKWLYRSWIEMQKYESNEWRTDLLIFIDVSNSDEKYKNEFRRLAALNCSVDNIRKSRRDPPMCSLIPYQSINDRFVDLSKQKRFENIEAEYDHYFKRVNAFTDDFDSFYVKLKDLSHYGYVDSILVAFDGYTRLNEHYDFLLRSDMDVFLTPLLARWLPKRCNEFIVGGGAYSNQFNQNRLKRISKVLNLKYASEWNLGSTWYSTPKQFRLVSYLTLISMVYLSNEEFSSIERQFKLGVMLWPEWHYGVLLLYGQNIAMNHLIATKQIKIVKLPDLIDFPSGNEKSIFKSVHIHVFHGDGLFSKFAFKSGRYDNWTVNDEDKTKTKYYALSNALDAKRFTDSQLYALFMQETKNKTTIFS